MRGVVRLPSANQKFAQLLMDGGYTEVFLTSLLSSGNLRRGSTGYCDGNAIACRAVSARNPVSLNSLQPERVTCTPWRHQHGSHPLEAADGLVREHSPSGRGDDVEAPVVDTSSVAPTVAPGRSAGQLWRKAGVASRAAAAFQKAGEEAQQREAAAAKEVLRANSARQKECAVRRAAAWPHKGALLDTGHHRPALRRDGRAAH